jgi:hypothetical protein
VSLYGAAVVIGAVLLGVAGLIVLGDSDRMSSSMPTQVPPRRLARYPLAVGAVLVVVGLVGLVVPK